MHATDIAAGAPTWVYILLVGLIVLGIRRLRTREAPVVVALLPAIAFFAWSIAGAVAFAARAGAGLASVCWASGALIGVLSTFLLAEPRGELVKGWRVRQPGTLLPLILYVGVFIARFACGAWAAIRPAEASTAIGIGVAVSAAMTARLIVAVARWRADTVGLG